MAAATSFAGRSALAAAVVAQVLAAAAAAASWNASDPAYVAFVCDPADACCAPYIAMARMAAQHVNEREASIVPELGGLPSGMPPLEIVELLTDTEHVYDRVKRYYEDTPAAMQAVALVGLPETEECEVLSPLVEVLDVPALSVSAVGALGLRGSTQDEYGNIYRMLAPNDELTHLLVDFMQRFNFTQAALLFDPSVHEEERIMHALTNHSTIFEPYPVTSLTQGDVNGIFDKVAETGVQTFVCIFQHPATMNAVVDFAYSRGIVGKKRSALGFVWISAGGYMPWGYEGAHRDYYKGMFSLEQHAYDDDRLHLIEGLWASTMPHQCGLAPEGVRFTTPDRNHLPYEACLGMASSYDAVAAIALGLATKLEESGRRLGDPSGTGTDGPDPACVVSRASALNAALHKGVTFAGLSGFVNRSGEPWKEKSGRWEVANLQTTEEGAHPAILYEWTDAEGFKEGHRRLAGGSGPGGEDTSDCWYVWPGGTCSQPEGVIHSPCEHTDCGSHGSCENRPAVGRDMGWCRCDEGYIGALCETRYAPYLLSDHPGAKIGAATVVGINVYVLRFGGINGNFPSSFSLRFAVSLHWTDDRLSHLKEGMYRLAEADALLDEGILWKPEVAIANAKVEPRGGSVHIGGDGRVELYEVREVTVEQGLDWQMFPFDSHELELRVLAKNPVYTKLQARDCTGEFINEDVKEACSNMAVAGSLPGIPYESIEKRWSKAWTPSEATLEVPQDSLQLSIRVTRSSQAFIVRTMLPSCFLVVISWAGFVITPQQLMPRFASGFISFLALQTFKNKVAQSLPSGATDLTWIDVYLNCVDLLMFMAVCENIYAQYANAHLSERCALRLDKVSCAVFPASYVVVLLVTLIFKDSVTEIYVVSLAYLGVFAVSLILFAIEDVVVYKNRIMKNEAKRLYALLKAQDEGEALPIALDLTARDIQSMFNWLDQDRSGFVNIEEVLPWVVKYFPVQDDQFEKLSELCREAIGAHGVHGVQVAAFKGMLIKIIDIILNKLQATSL